LRNKQIARGRKVVKLPIARHNNSLHLTQTKDNLL
jgi:hypothetical protein